MQTNKSNYPLSLYKIIIIYFYMIVNVFFVYTLPIEDRGTALFYIGVLTCSILCMPYKDNKRFLVFLSGAFLAFVLCFRNMSGIDDRVYFQIYEQACSMSWYELLRISNVEKGYMILNSLLSVFKLDYAIVLFIFSAIPLYFFWKSFYKYKVFCDVKAMILLFAATLYFQILAVALVRMFIAIAIVFYALDYIWGQQVNLKKYVFWIFIAFLFHRSSCIMLVLILSNIVDKDKIKKWWKWILGVCLVIMPFLMLLIAKVVVPILGSRYISYASIGSFSFKITNLDTLPFLLYALCFKQCIPREHNMKFYIGCMMVGLSSVMSVYSSMVSFGRVIFYFNLGLLIILPMIIKFTKSKFVYTMTWILVVLYAAFYMYKTQFWNVEHIEYLFPYQNLFFEL